MLIKSCRAGSVTCSSRPVGRSERGASVPCQFQLSSRKLDQATPVIADVEWFRLCELITHVGFIVTNPTRPAERASSHMRTVDQGGFVQDGGRQRGRLPASCARLQSRQFHAHAGDARADQREWSLTSLNEERQDRCQSPVPQPLFCLYGRSPYTLANVPRDFAAHRGSAGAAATAAA